ncbi:MAG: hypothetical protein J7M25_10355 [Deltaproteobacteria bacterium]|nr:hypothetical protein [Deltaproteobacteria bacterium]
MFKKAAGIALIVTMLAWAGCGKKFNCKNFCEKNKKCSDEIATVMSEGMPKAAQDKMKEMMKKEFSDIDKCTKRCEKSMKGDSDNAKKHKKDAEKCFKKSSCSDFAKCMKENMH